MKNLGTAALPNAKLERFNKLVSDMGSTYSKAKVEKRGDSGTLWSLEPELTEVDEVTLTRDNLLEIVFPKGYGEQQGPR